MIKDKRLINRLTALLMIIVFMGYSITSHAASKVSLDVSRKIVYRNTSVELIKDSFSANEAEAMDKYDGMYYKIKGVVKSVANDREFIVSGSSNKNATVVCRFKKSGSANAKIIEGDLVSVYGKLKCDKDNPVSISVTVDYVLPEKTKDIDESVYTLIKNFGSDYVSMDSDTMLSRSLDNKFNYRIPQSWAEVESELPNVKGYQYELNRIGNKKGAEFLFLFYIDDSYMSNRGDIIKTNEVRRAVIRNIIPETDWILHKNIPFIARDFDVVNLSTDYAVYGSYSGNYHDANKTRYYTEFMFLPDDGQAAEDKAVRVLLYVYTEDYHSDDILLMMRQMVQ